MGKVARAVEHMERVIKEGREYPDAFYRASTKFGLTAKQDGQLKAEWDRRNA